MRPLSGPPRAFTRYEPLAGSEVKHVVLELGGSDPFIVMPSADPDDAVATAVSARTSNNGQVCTHAKRFIVHDAVYDEFVRRFSDAIASLTGITSEMRLYAEEAFGPVAAVYRVDSPEQALRIANDTTFGLSSAVWSNDPEEQDRFIAGIDAGAVFVNGMSISYPEMPFGGTKDSGIGRELSLEGILEFCNAKSVWVR